MELSEQQHNIQQEGILDRIWRYKLHYVIVLPALFLIFLFKIIPFLWGLYLPFVDYKVFLGLFRSEFVGLDNLSRLFNQPAFLRVIINTVAINFGYILAASAISLLLALALSVIRSHRLRALLSTLFLMPFFIPTIVIAYIVMLLLSLNHSPFAFEKLILADPALFQPIIIGVEVLRTCGIPILIALAAIHAKHAAQGASEHRGGFVTMNLIPALRAIIAFMLIQLSAVLTTNFELMHMLVNPLVYETGDTLATYQFRTGLLMADMSMAGAVGLIQYVVQLICAILVYLLIRGFFVKDLFHSTGQNKTASIQAKDPAASIIGTMVSVLYGAVIVFLLYQLFIQPLFLKSDSGYRLLDELPISNLIAYPLLTLFAVFVHLLLTLTLAYPLTVKDLPGRNVYKAFLLMILVVGSGSMSEYLFYHKLGMIDTVFPYVTIGFFSIISVFVLKSIFNSKYSKLKEEAVLQGRGELHSFFYLFIPKIWKPLIGLGVLHYVMLINAYTTSLTYTAGPDRYSPTLLFRNLATGNSVTPGDPIVMQYAALISLPGVLLLLIFRRLLTSEVMISQTIKL